MRIRNLFPAATAIASVLALPLADFAASHSPVTEPAPPTSLPTTRASSPRELARQLQHGDAAARLAAATALAQLEDQAAPAVNPLITALSDPDEGVRAEAALALGKIGPAARDAAPALVKALKDKAANTNAAAALGKIKADPKLCVPALIHGKLLVWSAPAGVSLSLSVSTTKPGS